MCGITGIIKFDNGISVDLKNMTDSISHRGPDGEGYFSNNNIGFGHRRSIIDLSTMQINLLYRVMAFYFNLQR